MDLKKGGSAERRRKAPLSVLPQHQEDTNNGAQLLHTLTSRADVALAASIATFWLVVSRLFFGVNLRCSTVALCAPGVTFIAFRATIWALHRRSADVARIPCFAMKRRTSSVKKMAVGLIAASVLNSVGLLTAFWCKSVCSCHHSSIVAAIRGARPRIGPTEKLRPSSGCKDDDPRDLVTMVWTTTVDTFSLRNHWAVESVFKHQPCARVQVLSNTLPLDFFDRLRKDFGFSIKVARYDLEPGGELVGTPGSPGTRWISEMDRWRRESTAFHVHLSDVVRLLVLYKHGGTYIDFDHIVLKAMGTLPENTIGSEVCNDDNPDCLSATQLAELGVVEARNLHQGGMPASRMVFEEGKRYTPCNGVMVNWSPKTALVAAALSHADEHYDPSCWGCLGPRLWGRLLLDALPLKRVNATSLSLEPPARFYPFDYMTAAEHLTREVPETEVLLLQGEEVIGAHFYGKVTKDVVMRESSTMARVVEANTLLKALPAAHQPAECWSNGSWMPLLCG